METNEKIINEPYGFIYITTNMVNGEKYLGQKSFDEWNKWKTYLGSGKAFKNALKVYGKENFARNIICFCYSEEELNKAEYDLSMFLNVVEDRNWYNLEYGGNGCSGYHHTEETKKHLSEVLSGENHPWFGKHHTEESKNKMSESHKGIEPANKGKSATEETKQKIRDTWLNRSHTFSDEVKQKMSESHRGEKNHNYGKSPSYEVRKKISENHADVSGKNNPMYGIQHSKETKEIIRQKAIQRIKENGHPMKGKFLSDEQKKRLSECAKQRVRGSNPRSRKIIRLYDEKIYDCIIDVAEDNHMHRDTITKRCKLHKDFMYYDEWLLQQND
jgi:group I intron endonuclease